MIILVIIYVILFNGKERYTTDPFIEGMKDRFIDPLKRNYINQIDYWGNSPNINLERALYQPALTSDDIDWSKVSDYEYPRLVNYLSGRNDAVKIKSINAN
jgi:hypothetical protein